LQGVLVVGRGDGDGIDGFVLQKFPGVGEGGGSLLPFGLDKLGGLVQHGLIDVAHRYQIDVGQCGESLQMRLAPAAQADAGDANGIVGTLGRGPGRTFRAERYRSEFRRLASLLECAKDVTGGS
jgi:hypothetical protein